MKHLPFLALLIFFFAGILACTRTESPSQHSTAMSSKKDTLIVPLMDPEKAKDAMNKWLTLRTLLVGTLRGINVPNDTNFVAKGFHIPYTDLKRILDNVGDTSQVFAMLAIQDSAGIAGKPMISLIFQAPDNTPRKTLRFYDFTKPCPTDCPLATQ